MPRLNLHSFPTRRSSDLGDEHQRRVQAEHRVVEREDAQRAPGEEAAQRDVPRLVALAQQQRGDEEAADREEEDRKSTRLNSSHLVISYAVFCLKKKTRQE